MECPKCESGKIDSEKYCPGSSVHFHCYLSISGEHLHRKCDTCGFEISTPTKDVKGFSSLDDRQ